MPNLSRTRCRPISMMRGGAMLRTVCTGLAMERGCPTFLLKRGATVATMWGDPWRIGHRPLGRRKPWDGWVRRRWVGSLEATHRPTTSRLDPAAIRAGRNLGGHHQNAAQDRVRTGGERAPSCTRASGSQQPAMRSSGRTSPLQSDSDPSGRELARHATRPGRGQGPGCCAQPIRSQMLPSSLQIGSSLHSSPPPETAW